MRAIVALGWGAALLAACAGYGHLLGGRRSRATAADRAALGLAFLIVLGGVLERLAWVRAGVVAGILAPGWVAALARRERAGSDAPRRWLRESLRPGSARIAAVAFSGAVLLRLLAAGVSRGFSPYDDFRAYFVFSTKIAETGTLGSDPFSARRCLAGLGGSYFLDSLVLLALDHRSLHLADQGIGLVLFLGLLGSTLREFAIRPDLAWIPLLLAALVRPLHANVTSHLLVGALFLALWRRLAASPFPRPTGREWAELALLCAGLSALKTTAVPFCAILLGADFLGRVRSAGIRAALPGAAAAAAAAVVLSVPWALSMHASAGTFLYPVLGRGNYRFPAVHPEPLALLRILAVAAIPALVVAAFRYADPEARQLAGSERRALFSAWTATGAGSLALGVSSAGMGFLRHPFPVLFGTLLLALGAALAIRPRVAEGPARRTLLGVALGTSLLLGAVAAVRAPGWRAWIADVAFGLSGAPLEPAARRETYRALQAAIPPGAPVLAYVPRPYLFDFRRNPVFLLDYPGAFSPPPGLPLDGDPEQLRRYLLDRGIRYVAFAPDRFARRDPRGEYPWMARAIEGAARFEQRMERLARPERVLFRRDDLAAIDLGP